MAITKAPKPYLVLVTVHPTARNGIREAFTARVGQADNIEECRRLIREDRVAMSDTMGGLFEAPGSESRVYTAFRAEWAEVTKEL